MEDRGSAPPLQAGIWMGSHPAKQLHKVAKYESIAVAGHVLSLFSKEVRFPVSERLPGNYAVQKNKLEEDL